MNKAILVIDMPNCCKECIGYVLGLHNDFCDITKFIIPNREDKPSHCPLKPLPEHFIRFGYEDDYAEGYNDCLNEILGD